MAVSKLLRVEVSRGPNDRGETRWFVVPVYDRDGRTVSVPDDRGHSTREAAELEAETMVARSMGLVRN